MSGCFCIFMSGKWKQIIIHAMNINIREQESSAEAAWPVRPYSKSELAQAYAPGIAPTSALNRLAQWIKLNRPLGEALRETGYYARQHVFTSRQVELIFHYLGRP